MISACWLLSQTIWEVLSEVEWVSFFAPLERGKWGSLNRCGFRVSPAVCSNQYITLPPKDVAPYAHLYLPLMEFCLALRSPRWPPVYRSCFQVRSLSKTQATCVYHHSGPFIHKLAVLIQLQESSWTIQKWNAMTSEKGKQDVVYLCPTRRGR